MIEGFFQKYKEHKKSMESALRKYMYATQDLYRITGMDYSDMPKGQKEVKGIEVLLINVENLFNIYIKESSECTKERKKCMQKIKEINNLTYQLIIEIVYLDGITEDKDVVDSLEKYHNITYSPSYFRKIKSIAKTQFEEVLRKG